MSDDPYLNLADVGRYKVISRIGEGGMGVVYKGHHQDLDLDVAIKFLHPHLVRKQLNGERFLREARLAARLNHDSIVRVFDCGEMDGHFYLVMEYVDGDCLSDLIRDSGCMTSERALDIIQSVAEALAKAHEQLGMIHRDIKPANILLSSQGRVKLADFGMAKVSEAEQSSTTFTQEGVALGTPNYMSPEQFSNARDVDFRSDIFALGATLYHLLAARAPFDGESFVNIFRMVTERDPEPLPMSVPEGVEQLVAKMLEKLPEDRYQSYGDLLDAVGELRQRLADTKDGGTRTLDSSSPQTVIPELKVFGRTLRPARPSEDRVLLVVDIQRDFCPNGALGVPNGDEVVPIVNKLSRRFAHVVMTQDWHCEDHLSFASSHPGNKPLDRIELPYGSQILWPDHCVQGTLGAEFHPELEIANCELVIRKGYHREIDSYSAFFENDRRTPTGLAGYLRERGLTRLFLTGLATDFCVAYTALDARRLGFDVTVIEEACRGIDIEGSLDAAWEQMEEAGAVRA